MITKHITKLLAVLAIVAVSGSHLFAADTPEQQAQTAAERWLALIDTGKFDESWQSAAGVMKAELSPPKWQAHSESIRKPLGNLVSRKLKTAKSKKFPNVPGEHMLVDFDSAFTNKAQAVEIVYLTLEDGKWKVTAYLTK